MKFKTIRQTTHPHTQKEIDGDAKNNTKESIPLLEKMMNEQGSWNPWGIYFGMKNFFFLR